MPGDDAQRQASNTIPGAMRRLVLIPAAAVALAVAAPACGAGSDDAAGTLPPIRTTTTTSTTTTTPDSRRIFYEVQAGDNLSDIARRYQVPRAEIVTLNGLENNGEVIQVGQTLEIPNDMRLDMTLPPDPEATTSSSNPED